VEDLKLDQVERRAERAVRRTSLTSNEFALLQYQVRNVGRLKLISRWGTHPERRGLVPGRAIASGEVLPALPYFGRVRMVSFGSSKSLWVPTGADK
jgi:hypothetical protein